MSSQDSVGRAPPIVRAEPFDEHGSVIIVEGDLDLETAPQLGEVISGQIAAGHRHLVVDLSDATFLDSSAMGMLLHAVAPLRGDAAAAVVLAGVHGIVERSLAISGIGAMFSNFDTTEAAIGGMSGRSESADGAWRNLCHRPQAAL